jgi:SAM-dependent methyltransferase
MKLTRFNESCHLSETDIYAAEDECPICGFRGVRKRAAPIQRDPTIDLLHCPACQGLSASQMPTREYLDRFYDAYYEPDTDQKIATDGPIRRARRIRSWATAATSQPFRTIVDFGGGDGTIAALTADLMGKDQLDETQVQVVDYVKGERTKRGAVKIEYVRELKDAKDDCDLIIASSVLEHIPALGSLLRALVGKLRPGGVFYVGTPYARPFLRVGVDLCYPAHVHDLGDKFWGHLPISLTLPLKLTHSRPSICETTLRTAFGRTIIASALKTPARIECLWTRHPMFKLYGGWEAAFVRTA